jgi:hypothetical protein
VRTREKTSFFFGVMSLLLSALMFGIAPQYVFTTIVIYPAEILILCVYSRWVHVTYTVQGLYLLAVRVYTYKKRSWHYFLFDLCYYVNILNWVYIWFLPSSPALFVACYCLSHGSLASAVITWRNSLVFHDSDKVTSLFIHIYPPFTFTVIRCVGQHVVRSSSHLHLCHRHFYPDAHLRFPALTELPHLDPLRALLLSGGICKSFVETCRLLDLISLVVDVIWQLLYWKVWLLFNTPESYIEESFQFLLVDRRHKIESGQRTTSFSWLLNDRHSAIGRALSSVPPHLREACFMAGQLGMWSHRFPHP